MSKANARIRGNESVVWTDLEAAEPFSERPITDFIGMAPAPQPSEHPFLLVLPERLKSEMKEHAGQWVTHEQAGILTGRAYRDPDGFLYTVLAAAIPVDDAETNLVQVKQRPSSWPGVWQTLLKDQEQQILGWYHSHPGHGIFLSATDQATQNNYFSAPWQIAIVIDPVRDEFGVFAGQDVEALPDSAILPL